MQGRVIRIITTVALAVASSTLTPGAASPAEAVTLPFTPVADAHVDAGAPTRNFGHSTSLIADASPARRTFLTFAVSGLGEPVTSATLRLHVKDVADSPSTSGGTLRRVSATGWSETAVTWNHQPTIDGPQLDTLGTVARNRWYDLDVTSAVTGNGTYSFALTSTNGDGAYFDVRESGTNAPRLVVVTNPVLVGVGDIAHCQSSGDEATAKLLDGIRGIVFTAGDNAYPSGTAAEFANCYGPSWGRHKWRTRPTVGNHEYLTSAADPYYDYFGAAAGERGKGYYSYDVGAWHVVAMNSNCAQVSCAAGSTQEQWLRRDLAASNKRCTVAFWHHPLFTSGAHHGPEPAVRPLYQALYDHGAELLVTGHNHNYERFAPQDPAGGLDATRGIRQFVAGMGGANFYGFGTIRPNSEARDAVTWGVLKLTLRSAGYDWRFVPAAGKTYTDSGSGTCH